MARRSARLLKRENTPDVSTKSADNSHTASPADVGLPDLPELPELPEPGTKTPSQSKPSEGAQSSSKLAQATTTPTPTPHRNKSTKAPATVAEIHTPKDRTPIKPAGQEMHPAHHHASTAKILDEARWLGFQSLGAHTAPPKAVGLAVGQATPSKTPIPTASNTANIESSPNFRFRFKSPSSVLRGSKPDEAELSPSSRNILKDAGITGTPGAGCRALFGTSEWSSKADVSPQRKKAEAKGKMARFNDAHMKQFKNMDSIANHPSAFRADPARFKPVIGQSAKKSPSKPDVAKPEAGKLKRTQSKMDLAESSNSKRTQPKTAATDSGSKIPPTPLKRTQSRTDSTGSSLSRPGPSSQEGEGDRNPAAKRVKRTESDDAATTRPAPSENKTDAPTVATPARKITSQTALPRLAARLMTPTKSSVARSQSVKHVKTTSMIPALGRSPSTTNLARPSSTDQTMSPSSNLANLRAMRDNAKESMRKASHNLQRVRSILRTPNRKFSNDPTKVAAGTHMSPPVSSNFENASLAIPATAPVKKHVNFSTSTLERASHDELGKSPSPMKFRAGTEVPTGAVIYPNLGAVVKYPELSQDADTLTNSPSRRLVFGGETPNHPRSFSFESGQAINFGPASSGTIRKVRNSDPSEDKKRKLQTLQETSDKENDGPAEDETRSTKKAKLATPTPKTPAKTNKMPRNTPGGRSSTISKSRLAFLATPKRSKV